MTLSVTPIYAALMALLFVVLAANVIRLRRAHRVSLGAGKVDALDRAIRAHGNYSEYVPFALLLMAFYEVAGASAVEIHVYGLLLLVGRVAHATAIIKKRSRLPLRVIGMALTFSVLISCALRLLFQSL
ncbi:MAG: MAPEG family protein [Pseudomonadota bacterium]